MASLLEIVPIVAAEISRAHEQHGRSFEIANDDKRLRILVEEVGEIARAIDDLESARVDIDAIVIKRRTRDQLDAAAAKAVAARDHLLDEVAQVCATAARWLMTEIKETTSHG